MTRDSERRLTYDAERVVERLCKREGGTATLHGTTLTLPQERKFGDVASVQRYVDALLALNWVRAAYPVAAQPITVREKRSPKNAHYSPRDRSINLNFTNDGVWMLRELTVLHEVAHHLTRNAAMGHGPEFRTAFCHLVGEVIGPEVEWVLRTAFADQRLVVYNSPTM